MMLVVVLLGIVSAAFGVFAMVNPAFLRRSLDFWIEPRRLRLAMILRLAIGAVLVLSADQSRMPGLLRVIGVLAILGGFAIPILGFERIRSFAGWWAARDDSFLRAWAAVAVAFGAVLIYAAS